MKTILENKTFIYLSHINIIIFFTSKQYMYIIGVSNLDKKTLITQH